MAFIAKEKPIDEKPQNSSGGFVAKEKAITDTDLEQQKQQRTNQSIQSFNHPSIDNLLDENNSIPDTTNPDSNQQYWDKYIDNLPGWKGIKEAGTAFASIDNATGGQLPELPAYNDDEKAKLKEIFRRKDLSGKQKIDYLKTLGGHYYLNDQGEPIPLKQGEAPPAGHSIESVWGNQQSADENTDNYRGVVKDVAKRLYEALPNFVQGLGDIAEFAQVQATGKEGEWYKNLKQSTDALKFKKSTESNAPLFDTTGMSDLELSLMNPFSKENIHRWNLNPRNLISGTGADVMSSIIQFTLGGALAKSLGIGAKAGEAIEAITGGEEMGIKDIMKASGKGLGEVLGMRAKQLSPYILAGTATNMGEGLEFADDAGLKGRKKWAFGGIYGLTASIIESEFGLTGKIAKGQLKTARSIIGKQLAKGFEQVGGKELTEESLNTLYQNSLAAQAGWGKQVLSAVGDFAKATGKNMLSEAKEEVLQNIDKRALGEVFNKINQHSDFKKGVLSEEAIGDYINDAIGGALGAFGGSVLAPRRTVGNVRAERQSRQVTSAIKNGKVQNLLDAIDSAEKLKKISPEEAGLARMKINGYANYFQYLAGKDLTDDEKRKVSDISWQMENLQALIDKNKSNTIPSVQSDVEKYKNDHKALKEQLDILLGNKTAKDTKSKKTTDKTKPQAGETESEKEQETTNAKDLPIDEEDSQEYTTASSQQQGKVKREVKPKTDEENAHIDWADEQTEAKVVQDKLDELTAKKTITEPVKNALLNKIDELTPATKTKSKDKAEAAFRDLEKQIKSLPLESSSKDAEKAHKAAQAKARNIATTHNVEIPDYIHTAFNEKGNENKIAELHGIVKKAGEEALEIQTNVTATEQKVLQQAEKLNQTKSDKSNTVLNKFNNEGEDEEFIKEQMTDPDFKARMEIHENAVKIPGVSSYEQDEAIHILNEAGLLDDEHPRNKSHASTLINKAVKRIQWLKVHGKDNKRAEVLSEFTKTLFKLMADRKKEQILTGFHKKLKKHVEGLTADNANLKHKEISDHKKAIQEDSDHLAAQRRIANKKNRNEQPRKTDIAIVERHAKHTKQLTELQHKIKEIYPDKKQSEKKQESSSEKKPEQSTETKKQPTQTTDKKPNTKKIIDAIREKLSKKQFELKKKIVDGKEVTVYVEKGTDGPEYQRASSSGKEFTGSNESAHRGTIIDHLLREFVNGKIKTREAIIAEYNKFRKENPKETEGANEFTNNFLIDLLGEFQVIKNTAKGIELFTDFPVLWGEINGVKYAGQVDLIGVRESDGKVFIIDLKTSTQKRRGNKLYTEKDSMQQSRYGEMLYQQTGEEAALTIFPIIVEQKYNKYVSAKLEPDKDNNYSMAVVRDETIYPKKQAKKEEPKKEEESGINTGTAASEALIKKAEKLGFTKEQVNDMNKDERNEIATATSKDDVKDLLKKYNLKKKNKKKESDPELPLKQPKEKSDQLNPEYVGKVGYATPGSGKTTLSSNPNVIDGDDILAEELQKSNKEKNFFNGIVTKDNFGDAILAAMKNVWKKGEAEIFYDDCFRLAKQIASKQQKVVIFGSHRMLKEDFQHKLDFVIINKHDLTKLTKKVNGKEERRLSDKSINNIRESERKYTGETKTLDEGEYVDKHLLQDKMTDAEQKNYTKEQLDKHKKKKTAIKRRANPHKKQIVQLELKQKSNPSKWTKNDQANLLEARANYQLFEADRLEELDDLDRNEGPVTHGLNIVTLMESSIRRMIAAIMKYYANKLRDKYFKGNEDAYDEDKAIRELRKKMEVNEEKLTPAEMMNLEMTLRKGIREIKLKNKLNEIDNDTYLTPEQKEKHKKMLYAYKEENDKDVNSQTLSSYQQFNKGRQKLKYIYDKIRGFENATEAERLIYEIANDATFFNGKPFEANFRKSISELYRQGIVERSNKKKELAMHFLELLNEDKGKISGEQKLIQLFNFYHSVRNRPFIAMTIANENARPQLLFVNGAYEANLKDRVIQALNSITEEEFQQKINDFLKTYTYKTKYGATNQERQKRFDEQAALLTDLTGLEKEFWVRFINAESYNFKTGKIEKRFEGKTIDSILEHFVLGITENARDRKEFWASSKDRLLNRIANSKGSVVNTIALNATKEEQLAAIKPIFKDSEWNAVSSSSLVNYLTTALANINQPIYQEGFYKNNGVAKLYQGQDKGAEIMMSSGASAQHNDKQTTATNMSKKDIIQLCLQAFRNNIKEFGGSEKADKGTYLQNIGQYGEKDFIGFIKVKKYNEEEAIEKMKSICKRNGLIFEEEKALVEKEAIQLSMETNNLSTTEAKQFLYNYFVNGAEINEIVNGEYQQYGGFKMLIKRNSSTASPGEYMSSHIPGGLASTHNVLVVNIPKIKGFSLADGGGFVSGQHSAELKKSSGGKFHTIIKALTKFVDAKTGKSHLFKSNEINIDTLVKAFPNNEAYKEMKRILDDGLVDRIVTIDSAKLYNKEGEHKFDKTKVYQLFKDNSYSLNPNRGEVKDEHIVVVKTENYLIQQDLLNDGKFKKSIAPTQRIKNMMHSPEALIIQQKYNEVAKKELETFTGRLNNTYQDKKDFNAYLLSESLKKNNDTEEEKNQIAALMQQYDEEQVPDDDLDFINALLVAKISTDHPIVHKWAQKFIANIVKENALGRISNRADLVEIPYIPSSDLKLDGYRKKDGKTLLPTAAVPSSLGLRLPTKGRGFKTKQKAIDVIMNEHSLYRDMFIYREDGNYTEADIIDHELYQNEDGGWIIPGEYTMVTRIPADGNHSTSLVRAKYALPAEMMNSIITHHSLNELSGSDFDGDKRYLEGFFKEKKGEVRLDEKGEAMINEKTGKKLYKKKKQVFDDTQKGLANRAFHQDAQYFYDQNNYGEITTPINVHDYDKLLPEDTNKFSTFGINNYLDAREKNIVGLKVVSIAAKYQGIYDWLAAHNVKIKLAKNKGVEFGKDKLNLINIVKGWRMKKKMGNFLNLALDNVKSPKIERLGLNEVTAPMFCTALMFKPDGLNEDEWAKQVVEYFQSSAVQKYVKIVRAANSIGTKTKSGDIIKLINQEEIGPDGRKSGNLVSDFTNQEHKDLTTLQQLYYLSLDIDKIGKVISVTEGGIDSWAARENIRNILSDIEQNEMGVLDVKEMKNSPYIQLAKMVVDAMSDYLDKDSYEETTFGKEIYSDIKSRIDKRVSKRINNKQEFVESDNMSKSKLLALSKAILETITTLSRKLDKNINQFREEFVDGFEQESKNNLEKISGIDSEIKTINSQLNELKKKNADQKEIDKKQTEKETLEEKRKLFAAKQAIFDITSIENKTERIQREDANGNKTSSVSVKQIQLRIDMRKSDMLPEKKAELHNQMNYINTHDPKWMKEFVDYLIIETQMKTSKNSGGIFQLLSLPIHKQIQEDITKEKEKWNKKDGYPDTEKKKIINKIIENNPELATKNYSPTAIEKTIEKRYDSLNDAPKVIVVKNDTFKKIIDSGVAGVRKMMFKDNDPRYKIVDGMRVKDIFVLRSEDGIESEKQYKVTKTSMDSAQQITLEFWPQTKKEESSVQLNITQSTTTSSPPQQESQEPKEFTNHSGGATQSDAEWDLIGNQYGVVNHKHYLLSEDKEVADKRLRDKGVKRTPAEPFVGFVSKDKSTDDRLGEGQQKVTDAARQMGRIEATHIVRNSKLIRNWAQVKNADAIFAITSLLKPGDIMNYEKKALITQGKGGTGYAIQMAINEGKPVYVYDQTRNQWFKNIKGQWSKSEIPILTKNFAGIGTSKELTNNGKQAIKNVYEKTFSKRDEVKIEQQSSNKSKIVISSDPWTDQRNNKGISVIRGKEGSNQHYGNPFATINPTNRKDVVLVKDTATAVQMYKDWLNNKLDKQYPQFVQRKEWIQKQIADGKLDGKTLLYANTQANKTNQESHADALRDIINNRNQTKEENKKSDTLWDANEELIKQKDPFMTKEEFLSWPLIMQQKFIQC